MADYKLSDIKNLCEKLELLEKQNEQLSLIVTATMDLLFIKNVVTPTELHQAISKIINDENNTTVH